MKSFSESLTIHCVFRSDTDMSVCTYGKHETGKFDGNTVVFGSDMLGVDNPIQHTFQYSWPVSIGLW